MDTNADDVNAAAAVPTGGDDSLQPAASTTAPPPPPRTPPHTLTPSPPAHSSGPTLSMPTTSSDPFPFFDSATRSPTGSAPKAD